MFFLSVLVLGLLSGTGDATMTTVTAPQNVSLIVGENAVLPYVVTGRTNEAIKWGRSQGDGSILYFTQSHQVTAQDSSHYSICNNSTYTTNCTDFSLHIINLKKSDEGTYTVEVAGSALYTISVVTIELPTNVSLFWETPVRADAINNLTCYASQGSPIPTLNFFKNNQLLDASAANVTQLEGSVNYNGSVASILPTALTGADQGAVFRCEVSYVWMDNAKNVSLTVDLNGTERPVAYSLLLTLLSLLPMLLR